MSLLEMLSWPLLVWSGLTAFVLSTWLLMVCRRTNATRYLPRAYWSCLITGGVSDAGLLFAGLLRTLALIAIFPFIYALIFQQIGRAEVLPGAIVGTGHGILAGLVLPLAAQRCSGAKRPGLLGWRLGGATPLILVLVHAAYGALIGWVYALPSP